MQSLSLNFGSFFDNSLPSFAIVDCISFTFWDFPWLPGRCGSVDGINAWLLQTCAGGVHQPSGRVFRKLVLELTI